ncbi:MAG: Unknown protein [uncultured Sulfurovum sp.]|uniref:Uncharacterized protein n=1 Tax=uncultured Sulfurovum sp. TaxID=269237 RepID=A0A6S6TLL5_9BACT|nr:MAG: Unknown protein [uncultured Sulfurovum sp.]
MMKLFLLFSSFILFLSAQELVVVADKNFKEELTVEEIKDIFLSKKRFVDEKRILVMNHEFDDPLRKCFEKNILKKSRRSLERYWQKAHYKGKRPPKIVKSTEMLLSYMEKIEPSIGYVDANESAIKDLKILYRGTCE